MRVFIYAPHQSALCGNALIGLPLEILYPAVGNNIDIPRQTNAVILELSQPDTTIGYLLALAANQNIPTLCLIAKGKMLPEPLDQLRLDQRQNKRIKLAHYQPETLTHILERFINFVATRHQERANIKFTFRLTPALEKYLAWRARLARTDKAIFLRKFLTEELLAKDERYKKLNESSNVKS